MPKVEGERRIGLYMSRFVAYLDERWGWPALPSTVPKFISALQSITVATSTQNSSIQYSPPWALPPTGLITMCSTGLVLTFSGAPRLTCNLPPPLTRTLESQSDDVVINLSATETFFPEKRLFFLEGKRFYCVASSRYPWSGSG